MATKELEKRSQVDVHDEPSAEWGWHGEFPKAVQVVGWFVVVALLAMLVGPHKGNTENLWLIGMAVAVAGMLVWDLARRRTSWRR